MSVLDLLTEFAAQDKVREEAHRAYQALASRLYASDQDRLAAYDRWWDAEQGHQALGLRVRAVIAFAEGS